MLEEFYECPYCFEQKVAVVEKNDEIFYCCEACGHMFEAQEWDDIHEYTIREYESYYSEDEVGEIWDKLD